MNKLFMILLLFGILCIETAISQDDRSPPFALTNVTIIDGTGAEPVPGMTVLIEGERIRDVFKTGDKPLPENTEVRDLSGKYLIPGLINTHVHFTNFTMPTLSGEQRDAIKAKLMKIRKQRYEALERGDCEAVVETFDENVTFYNTRGMQVPSTDALFTMCQNLPRPLPRPVTEEEEVHVISEDAAWTVHVMEFEPRNIAPGVTRREVVTIIWRKTDEGWRTIHFHASLNPAPENR